MHACECVMSSANTSSAADEDDFSYDPHFMDLAFREAKLALTEGEVPIGCVFVDGRRRVLAAARNDVNRTKNPTRHAELICLQSVEDPRSPFSSSVVYVNCEPCIMCASALHKANVKGVYYGCPNPR